MGQITARLEVPTTAQPMCQGLGRSLHSCLAAPRAPRLPSGPSADGTAVPSAIPSISWGLLSFPPCPTFLAGNPSSPGAGGSITSRTALPAPSPWAGTQLAPLELLKPPNPAQSPVWGIHAGLSPCHGRAGGNAGVPRWRRGWGLSPEPSPTAGACSGTVVAWQSPDP